MKIIVSIRQVYGNETIYPVCAKAKLFAELAGTKTLTRSALVKIAALGYDIQVSQSAAVALACQLNAVAA